MGIYTGRVETDMGTVFCFILKAYMNSDILLQMAAIFFSIELFSESIGEVCVMVDFI